MFLVLFWPPNYKTIQVTAPKINQFFFSGMAPCGSILWRSIHLHLLLSTVNGRPTTQLSSPTSLSATTAWYHYTTTAFWKPMSLNGYCTIKLNNKVLGPVKALTYWAHSSRDMYINVNAEDQEQSFNKNVLWRKH